MISRGGSGWLAPALLLGVCAGLAWFIYQEIQAAPPPPEPGPAAEDRGPPLPEPPPEPDFTMPAAESFSAILERPLFSPTRRPPAEDAVTVEGSEPVLEVTLVGIIISAEEEIAIVKPKGATGFIRLSEGDAFRGWTLESIEADRVAFRRGDIEEHFELIYEEPPPVERPSRKTRRDRETERQRRLRQRNETREQNN